LRPSALVPASEERSQQGIAAAVPTAADHRTLVIFSAMSVSCVIRPGAQIFAAESTFDQCR
jgi:hypothetical protein